MKERIEECMKMVVLVDWNRVVASGNFGARAFENSRELREGEGKFREFSSRIRINSSSR